MAAILEINGKVYRGSRGQTLYESLEKSGLKLPGACGQRGVCKECRILVEAGDDLLSPRDEYESGLDYGYRLACRAVISSDSGTIRGIYSSLEDQRIETEGRRSLNDSFAFNPACRLEQDRVTLDSQVVGRFRGSILGVALDVGTSTVVLRIIDLKTGQTVFFDSFANPQAFAGGDVMSRISYASSQGQEPLRQALAMEINRVIGESGIPADRIYEIVVAANPTMRDLLMGFDVRGLGFKPFYSQLEAEKNQGKRDTTSAIVEPAATGIKMNPKGRVYGLPLPGCHVGGDIAAGILASGMGGDSRRMVFLDLGTNSEIVVENQGRMVAASCPAGPAFEGGEISSGMPGIPGAVEAVKIHPGSKIQLQVIGNQPPSGFCGSGLISLLGEMFVSGLINERGRFAGLPESASVETGRHEFPASAGCLTRNYSLESPAGKPKRLVIDGPGGLYIDEKDISLLLQAKAAITSGLRIALRSCGLEIAEIDVFCLAGAFGKYLDLESACESGILPGLPPEKFSVLGNSSIEGAEMALLSVEARRCMEKVVGGICHLELETEPDFYDLYADGCLLGEIS